MAAFDAWQRRRAAERIERQEDLHIAAIYANTNMDLPDNDRAQRVSELQDYYRELRLSVLNMGREQEPEAPDPMAEAFMRSSRRNLANVLPPQLPGESAIQQLPG